MSDFFPLSIEADRVRPITPEYGLLRGECWTTVPLPPPSRSIKPAIYGHFLEQTGSRPTFKPPISRHWVDRPQMNIFLSRIIHCRRRSLSRNGFLTRPAESLRSVCMSSTLGRRINSFRASGCGPTVHAPDSSSNLKPIFCKPTSAVLPYSSSISLAKLGA